MKVLWILNLCPPAVAGKLGKECSVKEGWVSGILERMTQEAPSSQMNRPELGLAFPVGEGEEEISLTLEIGKVRIACFGFRENSARPERYEEAGLMKRFREIFDAFQPELLHVFGTEYGHCLAAVKAFNRPKRVLIGLQGIISECAEEYLADLPAKVVRRTTLRDWIRQDSMLRQQKKFARRGEWEKQALLYCANVTGRTSFDRRAAIGMNPHAVYYFMNETLRKEFYEGEWSRQTCIPYRIFVSQADYPLKGFHYLLEAVGRIREEYPGVTVAVAGNSLVEDKTIKDRLKRSGYGAYLLQRMEELGLKEHIIFLGKLTGPRMKEEYLKCHTYVCCSSLENSPNSMGEAMCLGVPVVASDTGGIPSMIRHQEEGLLFPKGNPIALAKAILRLWKDDNLSVTLGKAARKRALKTHDGETNYKRLLEIYTEIMKE